MTYYDRRKGQFCTTFTFSKSPVKIANLFPEIPSILTKKQRKLRKLG